MDLYRVSFAKLNILSNTVCEVIVDDGVNINLEMVEEIHAAFRMNFSDQFSLLINKRNSYSTELDALIQFGKLPQINKIAIFAPNKLAKMSADFSADIPSSAALNIEVFINRENALTWLNNS